MKKLLPFLLVPVFYFTNPNAVGHEDIIATNLEGLTVAERDTIACNVISEYGDHRLIEGTLFSKTPFIILSDTPLFDNMPVPMDLFPTIEFCLATPGDGK